MSQYKRLTRDSRLVISTMRLQPTYQYRIAEQIGVSQSAVSQELSRNSVHGIYDHEKADLLAKARKKRTKTVLGNSKIQEFVKEKLKERKSPEQISRLALRGGIQVSRSSIYNYINANKELKKYRKHKKYRRRYKLSSKHGIPDRISIEERPEEAKQRYEYGHCEMDFVIGSGSLDCVLSLRNRKTRYPLFLKLKDKTELSTYSNLIKVLDPLKIKTLSTDNDKSFVCHTTIKQQTGIQTYFTKPAAPHEKGSVEQLNKELRVFYPKGTDFSKVTQADLDKVSELLRDTPMRVLNWKTPREALQEEFSLDSS